MDTLSFIKENRLLINSLAKRCKAENPRIFGSVANLTDNEKSDIDVLVDPMPGATLFDLGALQQELERVLGRRVDVLTPNDLPKKFKQKVLQAAIAI